MVLRGNQKKPTTSKAASQEVECSVPFRGFKSSSHLGNLPAPSLLSGMSSDPPLFFSLFVGGMEIQPLNTKKLKGQGTGWLGATKFCPGVRAEVVLPPKNGDAGDQLVVAHGKPVA